MKTFTSKLYSYVIIAVLIFITIITIHNTNQLNYVLPDSKEFIKKLGEILTSLETYKIVLFTILKTSLIIVSSVIISLITSLSCYFSKVMDNTISIIVSFIKVLPIISIILVLTIIFFNPKIRFIGTMIVSYIAVYPIIHETLLNSLKNIDKEIIDETKLIINKETNIQVIFSLYIPLIKTSIITSILQSFGLSLKVLVMSEVLFSVKGSFGEKISLSSQYMQFESLYIWTIILVIIILTIDTILRKIKNIYEN